MSLTEEQQQTLREAAERGYAWIQEHGPRLRLPDVSTVDLDLLDISSGDCVLGQLGGFVATLDMLTRQGHFDRSAEEEWTCQHGFVIPVVPIRDGSAAWEYLTHCWRTLISAGREGAQA